MYQPSEISCENDIFSGLRYKSVIPSSTLITYPKNEHFPRESIISASNRAVIRCVAPRLDVDPYGEMPHVVAKKWTVEVERTFLFIAILITIV